MIPHPRTVEDRIPKAEGNEVGWLVGWLVGCLFGWWLVVSGALAEGPGCFVRLRWYITNFNIPLMTAKATWKRTRRTSLALFVFQFVRIGTPTTCKISALSDICIGNE